MLLLDPSIEGVLDRDFIAALAARSPSILATIPAGDSAVQSLVEEALGIKADVDSARANENQAPSLYRLQALRRIAERGFDNIDALVLPTAPTVYSTAQVLANPVELNSRLGTYTNFVNLLDLCGLALPAAMRTDGIPFGITLLAPAGNDALLASIGRVFHADTKLKLGAKGLAQPPLAALPVSAHGDEIPIAVVGAHLSGMVLNVELKALSGRLHLL